MRQASERLLQQERQAALAVIMLNSSDLAARRKVLAINAEFGRRRKLEEPKKPKMYWK